MVQEHLRRVGHSANGGGSQPQEHHLDACSGSAEDEDDTADVGGLANGAAVPAVLFVTQNVSTFPHICRPCINRVHHTPIEVM